MCGVSPPPPPLFPHHKQPLHKHTHTAPSVVRGVPRGKEGGAEYLRRTRMPNKVLGGGGGVSQRQRPGGREGGRQEHGRAAEVSPEMNEEKRPRGEREGEKVSLSRAAFLLRHFSAGVAALLFSLFSGSRSKSSSCGTILRRNFVPVRTRSTELLLSSLNFWRCFCRWEVLLFRGRLDL